MILIVTDSFDKHADNVINLLNSQNANYFRLNLDVEALKNTALYFNGLYWTIKIKDGRILNSIDISCIWMRRAFVELTLEESNENSNDFKIWKSEWNKTLQGLFFHLEELPWLNELRKAFRAENKYFQLSLAKEIGFSIPEYVVSNDKKKLLAFHKKYNNVVLKLMTQDFYLMKDGSFQGIYVNQVSHEELMQFGNSSENPVFLQEYVEKLYEVRYTVVGEKHFVCKIESQRSQKASIDWRRYDIVNTPHLAIIPPNDIKIKVDFLMKKLGLNYGALDFVVNPLHEWFFLEINSMGQWLWIEDLTNLEISLEIANWLNQFDK